MGSGIDAMLAHITKIQAQTMASLINVKHGLFARVWWRWMPGESVVIPWPRCGWTKPDHLGNQINSSDPNDHYRPWLEYNVGRQGWDWDWKIHSIDGEQLLVKFRRKKSHWATIAAIMWTR